MKRLFVLALDGTPFTFLQKAVKLGVMPNFARLIVDSEFRQMDSVAPPISSVAWASFMTGQKPAQHGIWGFIDRYPATLQWYTPLSNHLQGKIFWETLSEQGKRVFIMNVPMNYPPRPVNGISICGFLCSDITKGTWPSEIGKVLKARGYIIDADTELAKRDLQTFLSHLHNVLDKRIETMWHFWKQEAWDFFLTHIMETDRLHHFFWEFMEKDDPRYAPHFYDFYRKIDLLIGEIDRATHGKSALLLLSDHGFTTLKKEVYLNPYFQRKGIQRLTNEVTEKLDELHPSSLAYSLYPGRIYINLQGREKNGSVRSGMDYERACQRIEQALQDLRDEDSGQPVIKEVLRHQQLLNPGQNVRFFLSEAEQTTADMERTPDMLAIAHEGYDLKGNLSRGNLFEKTIFNGTHTLHDAFLLSRGLSPPTSRFSIDQLSDLIQNYFGRDEAH